MSPTSVCEAVDERLKRIRTELERREKNESEGGCFSERDVAAANRLFAEILDVDMDLQDLFLIHKVPFDPARRAAAFAVLERWLSRAQDFPRSVSREDGAGLSSLEVNEFQANVKQARAMLTSDDEFFFSDECCEKIGDIVKEALEKGEVEFIDIHSSVE